MAHNPHNALFARTFLKPENAASFLRAVLPKALARQLDFTTLKTLRTHFVDRVLWARESDLLFSISFAGRKAFIYALFEHQSSIDRWMAFRLLCYIVHIWELFLKQNPKAKKLPLIIPIVLYHGPRT